MEIVIKKVKATRSIIKQMPQANTEVLKNGDVLGMVLNVDTDSYKTMLLAYNEEYYRISMQYSKGNSSVYRRIGRWTSSLDFKDPMLCNDFWEAYSKCCTIAETKHLYV